MQMAEQNAGNSFPQVTLKNTKHHTTKPNVEYTEE